MSGLPLIPFAEPTCVVAEKLRVKRQQNDHRQVTSPSKRTKTKTPSGDSNKSEPVDIVNPVPKSPPRRQDSYMDFDFDGPKSLDNLVEIANQELLSESLRGEVAFPPCLTNDDDVFELEYDKPTTSGKRAKNSEGELETMSHTRNEGLVDFDGSDIGIAYLEMTPSPETRRTKKSPYD